MTHASPIDCCIKALIKRRTPVACTTRVPDPRTHIGNAHSYYESALTHFFASTGFASVLAGAIFLSPTGALGATTAAGLFPVVGVGAATGDGAGAAAGVVVGDVTLGVTSDGATPEPVVVGDEAGCAVLGVSPLEASGVAEGAAVGNVDVADGVLGLVAGAVVWATAGITRASVRAVAVMSDFIGCLVLHVRGLSAGHEDIKRFDSGAVSSLN